MLKKERRKGRTENQSSDSSTPPSTQTFCYLFYQGPCPSDSNSMSLNKTHHTDQRWKPGEGSPLDEYRQGLQRVAAPEGVLEREFSAIIQ